MLWELDIGATHDESYDSLGKETKDHGVLRPEIIYNEGTTDGARHIEQIDDNSPPENDSKRVGATSDAISV